MNYKALFLYFAMFSFMPISSILAQENADILVIEGVGVNDRYVYLDTSNRVVTELPYERLFKLSDSVIAVIDKGKFGLINRKGKIITPIEYDNMEVIDDKYNGFVIVGLLNKDNNTLKKGIVDETGKVAIPVLFDQIKGYSEGLALVSNKEHGDDPYYVDYTGNEVISGYPYAKVFSEGLASIGRDEENPYSKDPDYALSEEDKKNSVGISIVSIDEVTGEPLRPSKFAPRYGFIDNKNNIVIPIQYEEASSFSDGLARVQHKRKIGFVDKTGKLIIPFQYDYADDFKDGFAIVVNKFKQGMIDKTGKIIVPIEYDKIVRDGNFIRVTNFENKDGLFDLEGKEIIPVKYSSVGKIHDGVSLVGNKEGFLHYDYRFINEKGEIIGDSIYQSANYFSEGLAKVMYRLKDDDGYYHDKYGFINTKGEMIINAIYDDAESFSDGLAKVQLLIKGEYGFDKKYGFINTKGERVVDIIYDEAKSFSNGLAKVKIKNDNGYYPIYRYGFINKQGEEIIPLKYTNMDEFKNGFVVADDVDNNELILDEEGNEYKIVLKKESDNVEVSMC